MSNYKLKRFSKIKFLHRVDFDLLLQMLTPFRSYIETKESAEWSDDPAQFPFDALSRILASPDGDVPVGLIDAFYYVDEMSAEALFDELYREALEAGIIFGGYDDLTPYDLALFIWLQNPELLQRLHAGRRIIKTRRFESFFSQGEATPDVSRPSVDRLETALNDYFVEAKKGGGARVFVFELENETWFLVRHGLPMKREAAIAEDGESTGLLFRPEIYDVLYYTHDNGQLHIHASTIGEKKMYCEMIGTHVFGDATFFVYDRQTAKYSLEPISINGRESLACNDVEGIESVTLVEIRFSINPRLRHVVIHKADCVFQSFADMGMAFPIQYKIEHIKLRVKFVGDKKCRTVSISEPNIAVFERDSDSGPINEFLKKRGFVLGGVEDDVTILQFRLDTGNLRDQSGSAGVLAERLEGRVRPGAAAPSGN